MAVSTFHWASEASLILAAFIRINEANCMLKALNKANKDAEILKDDEKPHPTLPGRSGSGPLAGTVKNLLEAAKTAGGFGGGSTKRLTVSTSSLEAPLMDAETAVRQVSGKRKGKIFAQRWFVHFILSIILGLACTLPFTFLFTFPESDGTEPIDEFRQFWQFTSSRQFQLFLNNMGTSSDRSLAQIDEIDYDNPMQGGFAGHSNLPMWIPYGPPQALVYAVIYAIAAILLLFGSGYVLTIESKTKEALAQQTLDKEHTEDKDFALRLARLQMSHNFYIRFECLIFITITRYTLASAICAQLVFSPSLTGSMALMLLIKSLLSNANGLLVFFLFGLGEGVFVQPLEKISMALKCIHHAPSQLVFWAEPRTPRRRSVKVTELLDAVDASSTSTGYEDGAHMFKVVCQAKAALLISARMKEWANRAKSGVLQRGLRNLGGGAGAFGGTKSGYNPVAFKPAGRRKQ